MKRLRRAWNRFAGMFAGGRRESELAAEIEAHLEMQTEENLKLGMSPQDARRAAVLKFGGVEAVKESYRDQRGLPWLEALAQDARHAIRGMRRDPGFTAAAVLSLALGIGATTAIFSVANAVLLRSLPYRDPGRLATISQGGAITAPLFETLRHEARSMESAALFVNLSLGLAGQGEPQRIPAARVSATLFGLLGVAPQLGRTFTADEDQPGRQNVVLIGDGLWKTRFAGDPGILGRAINLDGVPHTVVGVMPPGFQFPDGPELPSTAGPFPPAQMWRPMALLAGERTCKGCYNFAMIARLRPGVLPADARSEMSRIARASRPLTVLTLHDAVTANVRTPVKVLFGAVALALLIACVNVANLLLARGLRRRGEIALRLSLGATRGRVVRQLLTEAVLLAFLAAVLAVPIAWAGVRGVVALAPAGIPRLETVGLNAGMLAFALALGTLSALLFGVAPAILTALRAPAEALKSGGRAGIGGSSRLRSVLVAAECALSVVLLVASGLLAKSFLTVAHTPLGFHAENLVTMRTTLPADKYDKAHRAALVEQLVERCGALPGVISAAAVSTLPLTSESEGWGLHAEDNPNEDEWTMARVRAVTPGYFRTLGIRLKAGRGLTPDDRGATEVAVISETAAKRLWPGVVNPLGRRLKDRPPITIVGIVDDTRASGLDTEVRPYLYVPFRQFTPDKFALAVRSATDPANLAKAVKTEVWRIDKDQPVTHVATMQQLVADSIAPRRFQAVLMTLFGGFALVLAAVGIYGVLSYSVAQRTQEIGIRLALGASRLAVLTGVMKQAGALALGGVAAGLLGAALVVPLLRSLLYGVDATETSIFAGCALLLAGVAWVASLIPARRAANLDPMDCLRHE